MAAMATTIAVRASNTQTPPLLAARISSSVGSACSGSAGSEVVPAILNSPNSLSPFAGFYVGDDGKLMAVEVKTASKCSERLPHRKLPQLPAHRAAHYATNADAPQHHRQARKSAQQGGGESRLGHTLAETIVHGLNARDQLIWIQTRNRPANRKIVTPGYFSARSSHWVTANEAEVIAHTAGGRIWDLARQGQIGAMFLNVRRGGSRTECWIRRESLNRWIATRDTELGRYMPRPEAERALGLKNFTLATVAAAGAIRYAKGPEQNFPARCFFFLREDVMKIKHAFEKCSVPVKAYSNPGEFIALRHAMKNYLGRDSGLAGVRGVYLRNASYKSHNRRYSNLFLLPQILIDSGTQS
jgi:hypothetical protein